MHRLRICKYFVKKLLVFACKREYIRKIIFLTDLSLLELEKTKRTNRAETEKKIRIGLWWGWKHLLLVLLKMLYLLPMRESMNYFFWNFSFLIQWSPYILLGCKLIMAKVSMSRSWKQSEENDNPRNKNFERRNRFISLLWSIFDQLWKSFHQHPTCQLSKGLLFSE